MTELRRPSRIGFLMALFGAPGLFGAVVWLIGLGGAYAMRFAQVGAIGLLLILPAWFTVFAFLAWRAAKRGESGIRPYVFCALGANVASAVIYPLLIGLAALSGVYQDAIRSSDGTDLPFEAPGPMDAAMFSGLAAFFLGLFFFPIVAALFGWLMSRLGTPPRPPESA